MRRAFALLLPALLVTACSAAADSGPAPTPELLALPARPTQAATPPHIRAPVIIASPTFTPTPVTHIVQQGDTLVAIAVRYGVSVQALQAANNDVQPEFLSIGAVLLIPDPEEGDLPVPAALPTPTPAQIALGPLACHPLATGAVYCLVEARNSGEAPVAGVAARILIAGPDGIPIASTVAQAALDVIPPGGAAPLAAWFAPPGKTIAASEAHVVSAYQVAGASGEPPADPFALEVVSAQSAAHGSRWTVTGEVRNPTSSVARSVRVTLTLYDGVDRLVGFRTVTLAGALASGAVVPFSAWADALAPEVDRFALYAEGQP